MVLHTILIFTALFAFSRCTVVENWIDIGNNVCFEAKGDKKGVFKIPDGGLLDGIRLKHESGFVSCHARHEPYNSNWGCNSPWNNVKGMTGIIITDANKNPVLPLEMVNKGRRTFTYAGGNDAMSPVLTYRNTMFPLYVRKNQELQIWYGEDLYNSGEGDNGGKECVTVQALYRPSA